MEFTQPITLELRLFPRTPEPKRFRASTASSGEKMANLMDGHFSRFTADKLLDFLKRLDQKVTIHISPQKPGEPFQEVGFRAF